MFSLSDPSYVTFDPNDESDDDEPTTNNDADSNDVFSNDVLTNYSTSTSVTNKESSQQRRPPSFREHRQKSMSTFNLNSSSTLNLDNSVSLSTNHRSLPSNAAESLTNRFLSMFSPNRNAPSEESDSSLDPEHSLNLDNDSYESRLTQPNSFVFPTAAAASNLSINQGLFDRQPVVPMNDGRLQKSKSSYSLNVRTHEDHSLIGMSRNTNRYSDAGRMSNSSISSQPLSVDSMLASSRTRKTGTADIWMIGEDGSAVGRMTPKVVPRFRLSLPTTSESVSFKN